MSADFTPEKEDYRVLSPFKMQVLTNFPYIEADFDALTNYQLLCKVVEYLNNVITNENEVTEQVTSLYNAYVALQDYVNNYFDNLDLQEEVNTKIDEMAEDGTLTNIIKEYVDPIYQKYEDEMNTAYDGFVSTVSNRMLAQDENINVFKGQVGQQIATIDNKVDSATSGSPAGVYATVAALTAADPNHSKIYVVSDDGKWYYYNTSTTSWTAGGIYQSSVNTTDVDSNVIYFKQLKNDYSKYSEVIGKYLNSSGQLETETANKERCSVTSPLIPIGVDKDITLFVKFNEDLEDQAKWFAIGSFDNTESFITGSRQTVTSNFNKMSLPNGEVIYRCNFTADENASFIKISYRSYINGIAYFKYGECDNFINYIPNEKDQKINYYDIVEIGTNLEYLNGDINSSTGIFESNNYNISTKFFIYCPKGTIIKFKKDDLINTIYDASIFYYNTKNEYQNRVRYTRTDPRLDITIENDCYIKYSIRKLSSNDDSPLTRTDDIIEELKNIILIEKPKKDEILNNYSSFIRNCNHRGYFTYPENTLIAFKMSKEKGFDWVETDIQMTSDNVPVLLHDSTINRTARNWSDGSTLSTTINIADITYAEAYEYDFGQYKGYNHIHIATLEELLKLARKIGLNILIEIKSNIGETGAKIINDLVKKYNMIDHIAYQSVYPGYIRPLFALNPYVDYGIIGDHFTNRSEWDNYVKMQKSVYNRVFYLIEFSDLANLTSEILEDYINNDIDVGIWITDVSETDENIALIPDYLRYIVNDKNNLCKKYYDDNI